MTVFAALLPLLAAAGPVPAAPPRAVPQSTVRSVSSPIRTGPAPGAPSIRAVIRPYRELYEAPDPIASALTIPPGELADVPFAECKGSPCPVVAAPDDPNTPRVSRKDLVLALLARTPFERLSSAATAIAESPIQLDYSPGGGSGDHGRDRGWGRVSIGLRWRLDATGPVRHDPH